MMLRTLDRIAVSSRRVLAVMLGLAAVLTVLTGVVGASPTFAQAPWWGVSSDSRPSVLPAGGAGKIVIGAGNLGDLALGATEAEPVTITDALPAGVTATGIESTSAGRGGHLGELTCSTVFPATSVTCTWPGPGPLAPYELLEVVVDVNVGSHVSSENEVKVSGGEGFLCEQVAPGAGRFVGRFGDFCTSAEEEAGEFESQLDSTAVASTSARQPITVGSGATPFGVEDYSLALENEGGAPDTQAGSHPFQLTTTLALNESSEPTNPPALAKDVQLDWPPGLIGNPLPFAQCDEAEFSTIVNGAVNLCSANSAVGVASVTFVLHGGSVETESVPVFNLVPAPGEPARFGWEVDKAAVYVDSAVRTGSDYGVVVSIHNITQLVSFLSSRVTIWGVPGDSRHDNARGWSCVNAGAFIQEDESLPPCASVGQTQPPPFLTLPTSCTGPLQTTVQADSWKDPTPLAPLAASEPIPSLNGCDRLPFSASLSVAPDVQEASTPTGLTVHVHVPQEVSLDAKGLAAADVRDTTVALPEGIAVDPAGAGGLEACSEAEIGYLPGASKPPEQLRFTSGLPAPREAPAEPFCPDASKIGTVSITTPILAHPLEGYVYLAAQNENPFGSLVASYIVAEEKKSGVLVKLPGEVSLNQQTGQIVSTFLNTPQAPFEDLEIHFFDGERAPLATPAHCGTYTTNASFTPWSGNAPVNASSSFEITSGPSHSPCPGSSLPFAPSLTAGTTNNQAGGFSPFTMTMSREDGNQSLKSVQLHLPPGLSGVLTGVTLCGEAQANAGTCGPESLVGETTASVGLGGEPFSVKGGKVYLTGPYEGAPFGFSIVTPAVAGPFHLGQVVVRAKLEVDPHTTAVTVTSDSSGPYAIPPSIDGIPLQIKHVNVTISRPGLTFNPTNCSPLAITGTLSSIEESSSTVTVPFQATNCATLKFAPKFQVSTSGKDSKANGASLSVRLSYPSASLGAQANIARVKVDLPKQLPSRLTTLQMACTAARFEANPASCPSASIVGHARAITPLLPVPLEGPAYFVSHGGEAFPSLIMVLQGYGVTLDLVGTTFISKAGITSSTFKTVPDAPVSSFALILPQGRFSALTALGNPCTSKLAMPTEFLAQNGATIHRSTPISVTGCAKKKPLTRAQRLAAALKACHKKAKGRKRASCERKARKAYGAAKKKSRRK